MKMQFVKLYLTIFCVSLLAGCALTGQQGGQGNQPTVVAENREHPVNAYFLYSQAQLLLKVGKLDAAIEEIKLKRWQKNQEIADQKSEKYDTQRDIDRKENDLAHLRNEIDRLDHESAELEEAREWAAACLSRVRYPGGSTPR